MELVLAIVAGVLYATGLYLMLRRRLAQLIVGLSLLASGSNVLIFTAAGLTRGKPPLIPEGATVVARVVRRPGATIPDPHGHRHRFWRPRFLAGAGAPRPPRGGH